MKLRVIALISFALSACGQPAPEPQSVSEDSSAPPPLPEGVETVVFEDPTVDEPDATETTSDSTETPETSTEETIYWGVEEGEPLSILWEDLMPEGSEEELMRQYEEFYAMLEKRYAANATTLADADPYAGIAEGSEFDFMPQLGTFDTVEELDGEDVRIPGYVVPFDFDSKARHTEFLFVPYMGACIHTPPPPPNQIIFIRAEPAVRIDDIWTPYWIEGTLKTETTENDLGNTAYAMSMSKIEPYPAP